MYMFSFSRSVANILDYHVVERKILAKQCRLLCQLISYVCYMSRRVPKTVVLHRLSQAAAAIVVKYPVAVMLVDNMKYVAVCTKTNPKADHQQSNDQCNITDSGRQLKYKCSRQTY